MRGGLTHHTIYALFENWGKKCQKMRKLCLSEYYVVEYVEYLSLNFCIHTEVQLLSLINSKPVNFWYLSHRFCNESTKVRHNLNKIEELFSPTLLGKTLWKTMRCTWATLALRKAEQSWAKLSKAEQLWAQQCSAVLNDAQQCSAMLSNAHLAMIKVLWDLKARRRKAVPRAAAGYAGS